MRNSIVITFVLAALVAPLTSTAQQRGPEKPPPPLLSEIVQGMPKGDKQQVRVIVATLKPGETTPFHSHRFGDGLRAGRYVYVGDRRPRTHHGQGRPGRS